MTTQARIYMLAITIGPVGTFIAAGRRSRDLWFGSQWLSRVTARVCSLLQHHSQLDNQDLKLDFHHPRKDRIPESGATLSAQINQRYAAYAALLQNKIIIEVTVSPGAHPGESDDVLLSIMLEHACKTVNKEFRALVEDTKNHKLGRDGVLEDLLHLPGFERQLDAIENGDFIRIIAAWNLVDVADPADAEFQEKLKDSRCEAVALVNAGKNTRLFQAPVFSVDGRPKSDLDAGRDSVLAEFDDDRLDKRIRLQNLRLFAGVREGEHLDAIGLARRLALFRSPLKYKGAKDLPLLPFPALARVAFDSYIKNVAKTDSYSLKKISQTLESMTNNDKSEQALQVAIATPCYEPGSLIGDDPLFPWDAQILMEDGIDAAKNEFTSKREWSRKAVDTRPWRKLTQLMGDLHNRHGVPVPYYALIEFDGDGIGEALKELMPEKYRSLARELDEFADAAAACMEDPSISGCSFYVGGDEGLIFVPLNSLAEVLRRLTKLFDPVRQKSEQLYVEQVENHPETEIPNSVSLSFGVVIVHVKYDLRSARRVAKDALESAKYRKKEARQLKAQENTDSVSFVDRGWVEVREMPRGGSSRVSFGPVAKSELSAESSDLIPNSLPHEIRHLVELVDDNALSLSTAYALIDIARQLMDVENSSAESNSGRSIHQQLLTDTAKALPLIKLRRSGEKNKDKVRQRFCEQVAAGFKKHSDIENFANKLILANLLAQAQQQGVRSIRVENRELANG